MFRDHPPETRDQAQVEVEDILQPLDRRGRLVCEDLDEFWPGLVSGGPEGVFVELLDTVGDAVLDLGAGEGAVDAGGGLGRVAAKEVYDGVSLGRFCAEGRTYSACRGREHFHRSDKRCARHSGRTLAERPMVSFWHGGITCGESTGELTSTADDDHSWSHHGCEMTRGKQDGQK